MITNTEVIVIGGGAVGAACARELARAGHRVHLLDRGTQDGGAWRAAAGMLAPQIEAGEDDPLFELGLAGRERYVELAGELLETTGIDIQFWQEGIARVAASEEDVVRLKSRVAWQRQQGHLSDWFDEEEVQSRWPWIGPTYGALWASREAALDPVRLVEALAADAVAAGATLGHDEVVSIERRGDRVTGVTGREGRYAADQVVVAAGAWTSLLGELPRPIPIVPVRGQMAAFPWPAGIDRGIVHRGDVYVVARGGEAIAGSTMEPAGFDASVTPAGLASIFTGASALCPALTGLEVTRTWAGLRPVSPDGLPIIGAEPRLQGLWYATGHGRNGILLAAVTGRLIAQLLGGEPPESDMAVVRPERFFEW